MGEEGRIEVQGSRLLGVSLYWASGGLQRHPGIRKREEEEEDQSELRIH